MPSRFQTMKWAASDEFTTSTARMLLEYSWPIRWNTRSAPVRRRKPQSRIFRLERLGELSATGRSVEVSRSPGPPSSPPRSGRRDRFRRWRGGQYTGREGRACEKGRRPPADRGVKSLDASYLRSPRCWRSWVHPSCVFYSYAAREALAISASRGGSPRHKIAKTTPCKERNPLKTKRSLAWIFSPQKKHFNSSGKSLAHLHHPPIWQQRPRRYAIARFVSITRTFCRGDAGRRDTR